MDTRSRQVEEGGRFVTIADTNSGPGLPPRSCATSRDGLVYESGIECLLGADQTG